MIAFSAFNTGAAMTKEQEEQGFRVTDKRSFLDEDEKGTAESSPNAEDKSTDEQASAKEEKFPEQEAPPGPPIDFPSYILSYYTQGLVLLGEVPNPYTNKKEEDIEAVRHTIEILSMLEQKTKGNLSNEEQKLLENVLYELRMKFMAKTNKIKL
jgi:hypothetical protein